MEKDREKKQCKKLFICFNCKKFYDCFILYSTQELENIQVELNDIITNDNALEFDSYIESNIIELNTNENE